MVDVGDKDRTDRRAVAEATVRMQPETLRRIQAGTVEKGDVLGVARIAAITAVKKTPDLIPLCHAIAVAGVDVEFSTPGDDTLVVQVTVRATDRTGVEMEALTGAALAGLTVYDMCKAVDRGMTLETVRLLHKSGGRSGDWKA